MLQFYLGGTALNQTWLGNTQINLIGGPVSVSNSEVRNWINATGIINPEIWLAVDEFVSGLKADSVWNKFSAIYPLITDNLLDADTQFKINLVNTGSYTLSYNGGTFGYDGYTNGGGGSYINTGINPANDLYPIQGDGRIHLSFYTKDNFANSQQGHMGAFGYIELFPGFNVYHGYGIFTTGSSNDTYITVGAGNPATYPAGTDEQFVTNATGSGWWLSSNGTDAPWSSAYLNGNVILANNDINNGELNQYTNTPILIGTVNSNTGPVFGYSTLKYSFFTIGDDLTNTDALNTNNRIQTLQQQIDDIFGTSRAV
jgi:hypothetical protein